MSDQTAGFSERLTERGVQVQSLLEELLGAQARPGEVARPERLLAAMRHGTLDGGKRIRPFLLMEAAALFGASGEGPLRAAAALECIHCYSLIHDDLPAMDDDDLRRGRQTVHRAFDEATAILAGDSLQPLAFETLCDAATHPDPTIRCELTVMLAQAAGLGGMAGGQMLDLLGEKRRPSHDEVMTMQAMKTGALFRFACEAGAVIGDARQEERAALRRFGEAIGTAFQLADDMLDVTGTTENLGKRSAKDGHRNKATLVALKGLDETRRSSRAMLAEALAELRVFGARAAMLEAAAHFVVTRGN